MERYAVFHLKHRCGDSAIAKIEGMLTEIFTGRDQRKLFQEHLTKLRSSGTADESESGHHNPIDLDVHVLSRGFWPAFPIYDVTLPQAMSQCCQVLVLHSLLFSSPLLTPRSAVR
jgi:hypothetical protein